MSDFFTPDEEKHVEWAVDLFRGKKSRCRPL